MKKFENLKTPHNYAKSIDKSDTWVYKLISDGKLKSVKIDGVIFVVVKNK